MAIDWQGSVIVTSESWRNRSAYWIPIACALTLTVACDGCPPWGGGGDGPPTWQRTLATSGRIESVVAGGPGFIAAGRSGSQAAFWTSTDGESWSLVAQDPQVFPPSSEIWSVSTGGPGLIAVGSDVWTSADGLSWSRITTNIEADAVLRDIADDGSKIVAVGTSIVDPPNSSAVDEVEHGSIWATTDSQLANWTKSYTHPADFMQTSPPSVSIVLAVTATNDHIVSNGGPRFIAVGEVGEWKVSASLNSLLEDDDAAIWISDNGDTWTAQTLTETVFAVDHSDHQSRGAQTLYDVMAQGNSIYVGGLDEYAPAGLSTIWRSADYGATWVRWTAERPEEVPAFQDRHVIRALNVANNAFGYGELATGEIRFDNVAAVWRGATGRPRWKRMENSLFSGTGLYRGHDIAGKDDVVVVVGMHSSEGAIWTLARRD